MTETTNVELYVPMVKETVKKDDGRPLYFYTFPDNPKESDTQTGDGKDV